MKRKDKISITISILALIISLFVLIDKKKSEWRIKVNEEKRNAYLAYRLGEKLSIAVVAYLQTNKGDKVKIDDFKQKILVNLRDAQAYADHLNLKIDLSDLLQNEKTYSELNKGITEIVFERFDTIHSQKVSAVYKLVFWSNWLEMNAYISQQKVNGDWLVKEYKKILYGTLKTEAEKIKIDSEYLSNASNLNDLIRISKKLQDEIKTKFQM